jgi:hypothetical protein
LTEEATGDRLTEAKAHELMIIWSGYGVLVIIFGFGSAMLTDTVAARMTGDRLYYAHHRWLILVAMGLAAALTYGLDRLLKLRKAKVVIDKETGQEITLHYPHSLFFIPLKAWPYLLLLLGLVLQFTG